MFGKIGGFGKIREIGERPRRPRTVKADRIVVRPRPIRTAPKENKLEKAALQGVPGTLPERIVWKWLEDNGYRYITQGAEFGGRLILGGAVVDFLVYDLAGRVTCLRVMGDYWHGPEFPGRKARDDEQFARLTARGYLVVDLWESDIYQAVEQDRLNAYILEEVRA